MFGRFRKDLGHIGMLAAGLSVAMLASAAHAETEAELLDCSGEDNGLLSQEGSHSTMLTFFNESQAAKSIYWLNYTGKRVFYSQLAPGESYDQQTYMTHPWVVTSDSLGTCDAIFLPRSGSSVVRLK